jgi:hypothetical protein
VHHYPHRRVMNISDLDERNAPTPLADAYQHISNLGEFFVLFAAGLGLSFAALYSRSLEIVLGVAYIAAISYLALTFRNAPRATVFRGVAVTLGVILGFREIVLLFPIPILQAVFLAVGAALLLLRVVKWVRGILS